MRTLPLDMTSVPPTCWNEGAAARSGALESRTADTEIVAQIFNLPYRRFVIGRPADTVWGVEPAHTPQNAILRYGRLKICATACRLRIRHDTYDRDH